MNHKAIAVTLFIMAGVFLVLSVWMIHMVAEPGYDPEDSQRTFAGIMFALVTTISSVVGTAFWNSKKFL